MASMSNYLKNAIGNAIRGGGNGTALSAPAAVYVQLHTGVPGDDGTANVSAETSRQEITFGAAANGVITSTNTPLWADWDAGTESISHVSLWDASTGGNCLGTEAMSASKTINDGDDFDLPAGDVDWTFA